MLIENVLNGSGYQSAAGFSFPVNTLLLFPFFSLNAIVKFKLQFNRLHSLTWILSIKMQNIEACWGGVV